MLRSLERLQEKLLQKSRAVHPPWDRVLGALRYPVALLGDWLMGDIAVQATSLAYTTLLSLVPLLVFSFAMLKGIGARSDLRFVLHQFLRPLGGAADELTEAVLTFVANMRGAVLGALGLLFLLYTVISTIQQVEASFNAMWRIDRPRGFAKRLIEYLGMLLFGPLLLAAALELLGTAAHSSLAQWLEAIAPLGWLVRLLGRLSPYAIVTVIFTLMYSFLPSTRVEWRAAITGGVTAGIIWALVGKIFSAFIVASSHMMAVYTGFAIVLTTLIWVYVSWLILLIGAQLAFYVQFPEYMRYGREPMYLSGSAREQVGLTAMYLIARDHRSDRPWSTQSLAAQLEVPGAALEPVLASLQRADLILASERGSLRPSRTPALIELASVLEALRSERPGPPLADAPPAAVAAVMANIEAALRQCLAHRSLEDLIRPHSPP